jgi:hypothetical protein
MVKELLVKFNQNPSSVVDYIFEQRAKQNENENNPENSDDQQYETFVKEIHVQQEDKEDKVKTKLTPKLKREARNAKISIARDKRKAKKHSASVKPVTEPIVENLAVTVKSITI